MSTPKDGTNWFRFLISPTNKKPRSFDRGFLISCPFRILRRLYLDLVFQVDQVVSDNLHYR